MIPRSIASMLRALIERAAAARPLCTERNGIVVGRDVTGLGCIRAEGDNLVHHRSHFVGDIAIGYRTTIGANCTIRGPVTIGRYCQLGSNVGIYGRNHPLHHISTYTNGRLLDGLIAEYETVSPVRIGHDVQFGDSAIVLAGVEIGNGSVVGAGAVVKHPVAPYSIVAGVPARPIGERLEPDLARLVDALAWWDMTDDELAEIKWLFTIDLVANKSQSLAQLSNILERRAVTGQMEDLGDARHSR